MSLLLGNGDGTFQPHLDSVIGEKQAPFATGDFNSDGKLDLASVNATGCAAPW